MTLWPPYIEGPFYVGSEIFHISKSSDNFACFFNPATAAAFVPISGWHSDNTLNAGGPAPSTGLNPLVKPFILRS